MKNTIKKSIAFILLFSLLLVSMNFTTYAENTDEIEYIEEIEIEYDEHIDDFPSTYIPSNNVGMSRDIVQLKNIITVVKPTESFSGKSTITLNIPTSLTIIAFNPLDLIDSRHITVGTVDANTNTIELEYDTSSYVYSPTTNLFELYFNMPLSQTTIPTITSASDLMFTNYLLGDVDNNGSVTISDALMAQQIYTGKIVPTEQQLIVADVNRDGEINQADTAEILDYHVVSLAGFFGESNIVDLPSTPTAGIDESKYYAIAGVDNNKLWLKTPWTSFSLEQKSTSKLKYKFTYYQNGTYFINQENLPDNKISVNANCQITAGDNSNADCNQWYIVPYSGSYLFINKAYPSCFISSNGTDYDATLYLSINLYGALWNLYDNADFTVTNYYDIAFTVRNPWYSDENVGLDAISSFTSSAFSSLLGVNITINNVPYTSLADTCKTSRGISTSLFASNSVDYKSSEDGETHMHGYYSGTNIPIACTDKSGNCSAFMDDKEYITGRFNKTVLWSGHKMWQHQLNSSTNVWEENDIDTNRSYVTAARNNMLMINFYDGYEYMGLSPTKFALAIYLHEMAHFCGAPSHYHEEDVNGRCRAGEKGICSEDGCPSMNRVQAGGGVLKPRPKTCLMYYNYRDWQTIGIENMLCDGCKQDMLNYLNFN